MSYAVRVKVRPEESLYFPAQCVHCSRPGTPALPLRRRTGRITRIVDVPLCTACQEEVRRLSGEEERWLRLARLAAGLTVIVLLLLSFLLLPAALPFLVRLLLALSVAGLAGAALYGYLRRTSLKQARPEKQAILAAAEMVDFSWRATTFAFADETFARRFAALNETRLVEGEIPDNRQTEVTA